MESTAVKNEILEMTFNKSQTTKKEKVSTKDKLCFLVIAIIISTVLLGYLLA